MPDINVLWCMHYIFGTCNTNVTVYYGQVLDWLGINHIPQGTIDLLLRDDIGPVRYGGLA